MAQENRSVYWSVTVYSFVAVQWCCPAVNEEFPAADTGTSTRTTRVAGTVTIVPYKLTESSAQSLDRFGRQGGHDRRYSRDPLPVFSAKGHCEQFCHGQGCPVFDIVHPAFPQPTTASPTLHGTPKDGFGEAVVACDMPEPCKFPSLYSC